MKIFILLLIVGFVAAEFKVKRVGDMTKYHDECGAAHHIPAATLARFKEQEYVADRDSYCHLLCIAKKMGIFDEEHGIKVDNWVAQVAFVNKLTVDEVKPKIEAYVKEIAPHKDDHCFWASKAFELTAKQAGWDVVEFPEPSPRFGGPLP